MRFATVLKVNNVCSGLLFAPVSYQLVLIAFFNKVYFENSLFISAFDSRYLDFFPNID